MLNVRLAASSVLLAVILGGPGCRFYPRPEGWVEPGSIPDSQMGCLDGSSEVIARYLRGKESGKRVQTLFACAADSMRMFSLVIAGEHAGRYTIRDLMNFLNTYFLREFKISDSFFSEILTLKKALLGGADDSISLQDLERIKKVLALLGDHAESLGEFQPLTPENVSQWSPEKMDRAVAAITASGLALSHWMTEASGAYRFDQIYSLLSRFEENSKALGPDMMSTIVEVRRWVPFIKAAKAAIIDGNDTQISATDWGLLIRLGVRAYAMALRVSHFRQHASDWVTRDDRSRLTGLARNALSFLDEAIQRRPRPYWSFDELEKLIDLMPVDLPIRKNTLKGVLRPVALRLFGPTRPSEIGSESPPGIHQKTVQRLIADFELWAQAQEKLDFDEFGEATPAEGIRPHEARPYTIGKGTIERHLRSLAPQGGPRILFDKTEPKSYRIYLSNGNWGQPLTHWEWSVHNWSRLISRVSIRGYTPRTTENKPKKILRDDLIQLYRDFEPLLIDMGIMDPTVPITNETLDENYQVGDLAHFASNGDGLIDEGEMASLLISLFSARDMGFDLQARVKARCSSPTTECVRETLIAEFDVLYQSFPDLTREWRAADHATRHHTLKRLEFLAFKREKNPGELWIYAEMLGIAATLHQLEFAYGRYDLNGDGEVNYKEAMVGLPLFGGPLQKMSKEKGGALGGLVGGFILEAVYTFIISRDESPWDFGPILGWILTPANLRDTRVRRLDLIRRFAKLRADNM